MLPRLFGNLPFESTLPEGLSPYELAVQMARDWTALNACLDFAPEINSLTSSGPLSVGPRTERCNRAVWGVRNARFELRDKHPKRFNRPFTLLVQKYENYGATFFHWECPESGFPHGWEIRPVCSGFPYNWISERGVWGPRLDYHNHRVALFETALEYQGERWLIVPWRLVSDSGPFPQPAIPMQSELWEIPGCPAGITWETGVCEVMAVPYRFEDIWGAR